jgi:hypothetical protein
MAVSSPPRRPAQDDPEALIPEARQHQRRRRLLALATVTVAVALGLGIYGAATGGGPLGTARGSLGLGGTPKTCRPSQLKTQPIFFGFGIALSPGAGGLTFTDTSGSACSLPPGTPRVSLFWHGQRLAVRQIHVAHFARLTGIPRHGEPVVRVLGPSKAGFVDFYWRNWCGPPKVTTRHPMILNFRFGNAPAVSLRGSFRSPQCTHPGAPSTITATQPLRSSS